MLKDRKLVLVLSVTVAIILLIGVLRPREIDWSPSFSANDKIPYGNYILYRSLGDLFGKQKIAINHNSPHQVIAEADDVTSLICIQNKFEPSESEVEQLLDFAASGNNLFIAASNTWGLFFDTLKIFTASDVNLPSIMKIIDEDTLAGYEANFTNPALRTDSGYWHKKTAVSFYYNITNSAFLNQIDSSGGLVSEATVLAQNAKGRPVFIKLHYGKGFIFLHNNPFAFSNYYMLEPHSAEYVSKCLSYLPSESQILWDEYYKTGMNGGISSSLNFILKQKSLKWAYYTAMLSLLIYVLFNIKRRQRMVPVVVPYQNASVQFTQTVGTLYYNQSNHKDIARKKSNYLLEFIRNRYNLETSVLNDEFSRKLSNKSGVEQARLQYLIMQMNGLAGKRWISDTELIELNNNIDYFRKNCQ